VVLFFGNIFSDGLACGLVVFFTLGGTPQNLWHCSFFLASLRERVMNQAGSGAVHTLTAFILVELEVLHDCSWFIRILQTVTVTT
jgi:hypothetical protein